MRLLLAHASFRAMTSFFSRLPWAVLRFPVGAPSSHTFSATVLPFQRNVRLTYWKQALRRFPDSFQHLSSTIMPFRMTRRFLLHLFIRNNSWYILAFLAYPFFQLLFSTPFVFRDVLTPKKILFLNDVVFSHFYESMPRSPSIIPPLLLISFLFMTNGLGTPSFRMSFDDELLTPATYHSSPLD